MTLHALRTLTATLSCLALGACQTTSQTSALQCGAGGAGIAYLACKALGKSDHDCLAAAAVVGVGGAAICYNYASNLEQRRKALAGQENNLDARIRYVRGMNEDTVALNNNLRKRVGDVTRSTDQLVAQIKAKQLNQQQITQARQARDAEVQQAQAEVGKSQEALAEVRLYRSTLKQPSSELDAAIARQQALYDDAQRQVKALAEQRARV